MPIQELRILPPMAVARLGSSPKPVDAYELVISKENPLGFRTIEPRESLVIDPETGEVTRQWIPPEIRFKDGEQIRPVAPFLEVFALTSNDSLEPLTLDLLRAEGLEPQDVQWTIDVGNLKIFRRTHDLRDQVLAQAVFSDHAVHELRGTCGNFLKRSFIPFGTVRYIRPTRDHGQIRLRFTPATGKVYGSSSKRFDPDLRREVDDPVFDGPDDPRIVYDPKKGTWRGYADNVGDPTLTNPSDIYQGFPSEDETKGAISWGYLDDVCDGSISVALTLKRKRLEARAWVSVGVPAFAPDSQPIRTVADEIEQAILGPEVSNQQCSVDAAMEIVRRALDTVRLMNTMVMNQNTVDGRVNIAHTLVTQDTNDFGRHFEPIMAPGLVDNLAVRALHERVLTALKAGFAPWFAQVLRQPEEIGDLSDKGRRKMPPMLRGADGRALTLTRRQISQIVKAAVHGLFCKESKKGQGE